MGNTTKVYQLRKKYIKKTLVPVEEFLYGHQ